jgi:hypothetical protein
MRLFGRLKPHERREDDDSRKVYYQLGAFSECKAGDERADLYLRAALAICGLTCRYVEGLQSRIVSSGALGLGWFLRLTPRPPIEEAFTKTRQNMHELGRSLSGEAREASIQMP